MYSICGNDRWEEREEREKENKDESRCALLSSGLFLEGMYCCWIYMYRYNTDLQIEYPHTTCTCIMNMAISICPIFYNSTELMNDKAWVLLIRLIRLILILTVLHVPPSLLLPPLSLSLFSHNLAYCTPPHNIFPSLISSPSSLPAPFPAPPSSSPFIYHLPLPLFLPPSSLFPFLLLPHFPLSPIFFVTLFLNLSSLSSLSLSISLSLSFFHCLFLEPQCIYCTEGQEQQHKFSLPDITPNLYGFITTQSITAWEGNDSGKDR